ncbi:MAG: hypothetical protein E7241_05080 [Lachnospiraceae bacterium]|nr:hypothetical protein [Lachnospiraceae bacterium]
MSMDLARQDFAMTPDYLLAGTTIPVITAVKTAASALAAGAPVKLNSSGKAAKVTESSGTVSVEGLYGIAADSAKQNEDVTIYLTGEFFADKLAYEENVTAADVEVAFRNIGIFLK